MPQNDYSARIVSEFFWFIEFKKKKNNDVLDKGVDYDKGNKIY